MIPFEARQLINPKYHQVMVDNGFTVEATRHINIARYIVEGSICLDLPPSIRVTDRNELYRIIFEHGYARGREQGKSDSIRILLQNFTEMILNPKEKV